MFDPDKVVAESGLRVKQALFMWCLGKLIIHAYVVLGVELSGKELYRTPEQAELYARQGKGIRRSLHQDGLAIDIALFADTTGPDGVPDGVVEYQTDSRAYAALGSYWKSLHPLCRWGGDFASADGNHFSITHQGRA